MPEPDLTPINWSDSDLDELSRIDRRDVEEASAKYRRLAPERTKDLLDAEEVEDGDE